MTWYTKRGNKIFPLERDIQKTILDYLKLKKIFAWKSNTVGIKKENGKYIPAGMRGVSDIIGILPGGRFLAIEVKRDRKQLLSPYQEIFMENIRAQGGIAFVAYGLDDVMARVC